MSYLKRPIPEKETCDYELWKRSYEDWACCELLNRITDKPQVDPAWIVEVFLYEMRAYAIQQRSDETGGINGFEIAKKLAEELLLKVEHPRE
jgi:hypothetical protein